MAWATMGSSDRARLKCSWSVSHAAASVSLAARPVSTAASRPSEYEKPPIGKAGEASHISCIKLESSMGVAVLTVGVLGVVVVTACGVCAVLWFKRFFNGVNNQVHGTQHVR